MPALYDAHVHLAGEKLQPFHNEIAASYSAMGLGKAVIMGTAPEDWNRVLEIASCDPRFVPAIGLHPWHVNHTQAGWMGQMLSVLDQGVHIIGEIGLDQWIKGHDIEKQLEAFRWQLSLASKRNLPTSIHCLKAHEPLLETLRATELPKRGFKLHAYNGPLDTMEPLLELGAYFSFNSGQLKPNAKRIRELIKLVPTNRVLIETDAPDFLPPVELREFELSDPALCHPGNIRAAYRAISNLRGCSYENLAQSVADNFKRYFLDEAV
ncbi:MAG: TatD family hydrolase [Opitutales bacterium]